jgi:hypothetical protein
VDGNEEIALSYSKKWSRFNLVERSSSHLNSCVWLLCCGMNRIWKFHVSEPDRVELERRVRSQTAPARMVERARIVLLSADR